LNKIISGKISFFITYQNKTPWFKLRHPERLRWPPKLNHYSNTKGFLMLNDLIKTPEPDSITRTLSMTIAAEKSFNANRHLGTSNIVRPRDLPALTGLSRTTIWRLERTGDFPKRIRLSAGAVGYKMADIQTWLDSRQIVGGSHD
jgi:prophage regulatory protein